MAHSDNIIRRAAALLISFIMIFTCCFFPDSALSAKAAVLNNPNGVFLGEAFNIAGGNRYHEPRSQWVNFLDKYSKTDFYLGTPFDYWLYSASPRGDVWQAAEGYGSYLAQGGGSYVDGGLNSTGFIWHAAAKSLAEGSGLDMSVTGKWVPMLNGFNYNGFSRQCWTGATTAGMISYQNTASSITNSAPSPICSPAEYSTRAI